MGPPVSFPETTEYGALLSRDGNRLYFSSNREGGYGGFDLYVSHRQEAGWGAPVNLGPELNSAQDEADVALSPDEKTAILAFSRPESLAGSLDLYVRRKGESGWSPFVHLGPWVNTPGKDACPWLGYDGETLYLNSTWEGLLEGSERKDSRWGSVYVIRVRGGF